MTSDRIITKPRKGTKVILEFYTEIWYCYKDGKSMDNPYFTETSYYAICGLCDELELEVIQTIDMSNLDEDGNEMP